MSGSQSEPSQSLWAAARACLDTSEPAAKVAATAAAAAAFATGALSLDDDAPAAPIDTPGRPERPRLIDPRSLPQRGLGTPTGRASGARSSDPR